MFSFYCWLCREHYSGCFKEEADKHKDCVQPEIPVIKFDGPLSISSIHTNIPKEVLENFYNTDIEKMLSETSFKNELAKDS